MKTSRIIIFSFIVFLVACVLVLFIYSEQHEEGKQKGLQSSTIDLPVFSVIVAESETLTFTIESGKTNQLIKKKSKDAQKETLTYSIKDDTLYISETYDARNPERSLIIRCTDIHTIIEKANNEIRLNGFKTDSLVVYANSSSIIAGDGHGDRTGKKECSVKQFSFIGKNRSYLSMRNMTIGQMILRLDNSIANLHENKNAIKKASVVIENNAEFKDEGNNADIIQLDFKSDESSYYSLYKTKSVPK